VREAMLRAGCWEPALVRDSAGVRAANAVLKAQGLEEDGDGRR